MIKLLFLMLLQTAMLAGGQVLLKLGMNNMDPFTWKWDYLLHQVLLNGYFIIGLVLLVGANLFWLWLLKYYPFSIIYPLTSLGFALGMLAGLFIFGETVTALQWAGLVVIIAGCFMIAH